MASAAIRKELECPVCLNLYTDPVTLRCGHNFCWVCIDQVQYAEEETGLYSCPECRAEFQERPVLIKNITLSNIVENFLSTHWDCEDSPVPAAMSCLHCETSLCDNHLRVHRKGTEHVLTNPSTNLEKRKCSVHKELLNYFCIEDAACICVSCLAEEHRGHQVELLHEVSEKKKKKLIKDLQNLLTEGDETEEIVQSLEEHWKKAKEAAARETERVSGQFRTIRRWLDDLEKRILSVVSKKEKKLARSVSYMVKKLEKKSYEMVRKMRHIVELCNISDPLTVLLDPDTGDLCDLEEEEGDKDTGGHDGGDEEDIGRHDGGDEEDTGGHDGGDEHTGEHDGSDEEDTGEHDGSDEEDTGGHDGSDDEYTAGHGGGDEDTDDFCNSEEEGDEDTGGHIKGEWSMALISHISHTLFDIIRGVTFYMQDPADILLDENTAGNYILISDDMKAATYTRIDQNRPKTAERFQLRQVISSRGFTSGCYYWDVEISGSRWWRVGMCYPSIDRRGPQSYIGDNNKSWGLYGGQGYNKQCTVMYDGKEIWLHHRISSDRVRIFVDYEAGQLSFYELCDPIRHLHTFTTTFTEPLHAALCVWEGSLKIMGGSSDCEEPSS